MFKITEAAETVTRTYKKKINFIIGRSNSHAYRDALTKQIKRVAKGRDYKKLEMDEEQEAIAIAAVGTVLLGWSKADGSTTEIPPFTPENAKNLLLSDPDAREFIFAVADTLEEFEQEYQEQLLKKSAPVTTGS